MIPLALQHMGKSSVTVLKCDIPLAKGKYWHISWVSGTWHKPKETENGSEESEPKNTSFFPLATQFKVSAYDSEASELE